MAVARCSEFASIWVGSMRARDRRRTAPCAYCAVARGTEAEHVFPESWYPDGTVPSSMLTVPACRRCNASYGVLEETLRLPLVAGLQRGAPTSIGVVERALRAVDARAGHSVTDASHRAARSRSIARRVRILTRGRNSTACCRSSVALCSNNDSRRTSRHRRPIRLGRPRRTLTTRDEIREGRLLPQDQTCRAAPRYQQGGGPRSSDRLMVRAGGSEPPPRGSRPRAAAS